MMPEHPESLELELPENFSELCLTGSTQDIVDAVLKCNPAADPVEVWNLFELRSHDATSESENL
jgi:hypothetical protein